jgi:hypothetical protein
MLEPFDGAFTKTSNLKYALRNKMNPNDKSISAKPIIKSIIGGMIIFSPILVGKLNEINLRR